MVPPRRSHLTRFLRLMDQCVITQQGYRFSVQPAFTVTAAPKAKNVTRFACAAERLHRGVRASNRHQRRLLADIHLDELATNGKQSRLHAVIDNKPNLGARD